MLFLSDEERENLKEDIDSTINNLLAAKYLLQSGRVELLSTQLEDAFCKIQDINDTYCVEVK